MNGKGCFAERNKEFVSRVIAHRGASAAAPENTLAAFTTAVTQGADGIELDVRPTADGTLAVCHDPHLPDGRALIELRAGDLPADVPQLHAALDVCDAVDLVNVEIKNWPGEPGFDESLRIADAVAEVLASRPAGEQGRYLVSCFHRPTLDRVRAVAPDLPTGWLVLGLSDSDGAGTLAEIVDGGHDAVHPHHSAVTPELVERAHALGLAVNTWTCDDPDRIRWLAGAGVDGIVTNVPDVALAALDRHQRIT